jgi:CHAD domain-containing protein
MSMEAGRQLKTIAKELVRAGKKARRRGKPKDWHKLRTTSRRMRGALAAFAPALDPAVHPRLARVAKQITKLPGEVRDLDVAIANLRFLREGAPTPVERRAADEMLQRVSRERDRRERKVRRKLERKKPAQRLRARLKKALRHPPPGPVGEDSQVLVETSRVAQERLLGIGGWEDDQKAHALRVAVKKHRGALGAWVEAHPGHVREHRGALDTLQKVQSILGEHHDWSELSGRLDDRRRKLANDGARHKELVGYEALLGRARLEQKARYDSYRAGLHDRLSALLTEERAVPPRARAGRSIFEMIAVNN